ncbi:MAG: nitronate monooxygenase [Lentisphaerae bacterium]|nr:nitronate monooxygenase [Lentisphaerota bacterium]MCP4099829.1 nitronate monooxygenase [Lentisphaerota bacterium]
MINQILPPLIIGDLKINVPIIQGGMGVKVSTAALASAVANCGAAGTIASVGLAHGKVTGVKDYVEYSNQALQNEIRKARKLTKGVFGVNIMVALSNYEEMVRTAVKEKVDYIISGAGLPLSLPKYAQGSQVKLIPIVSSARSADIILKTWKRRYNRLPDAVIVEGPMAGGHLGFKAEDIINNTADRLEKLVPDVIKTLKKYTNESKKEIPVIAAGGVFDGKDLVKFLKLGAKGVQMGTRFVATNECPVSDKFKQLYVAAKKEDVIITKSPVGMPGRALKTEFINRLRRLEKIPFKCDFRCLQSCDVKNAPYCIAKAMCSAINGEFDDSIVFAGSNVTRVNKIISVAELIKSIISEAKEALTSKLATLPV